MSTDPPVRSMSLEEAPRATCRRKIDWNAIERDYREGRLSLRDLACKHGCSHSTIANRAVRLQWARACHAIASPMSNGRRDGQLPNKSNA